MRHRGEELALRLIRLFRSPPGLGSRLERRVGAVRTCIRCAPTLAGST